MVRYELRGVVDDVALSALHESEVVIPWRRRLEEHSLTWVQAYDGERLVGFVNLAWDGGLHAFLLDTVVDPGSRRRGVGVELVRRAADAAREAGCTWLHVDHEARLDDFYLHACGFAPTAAGLLRLT